MFTVFINHRRHNTALQTLCLNGHEFDLGYNPIGAAGAVAIGEGLRYDV